MPEMLIEEDRLMPTAIEWTEETWNPTTGCDRVSPGCDNCYALTLAKRLKAIGQAKYQRDGDPRTSGPGFGLTTHEDTLTLPLSWVRRRRVFVNSMSDLFHDDVPDEFIAKVFAVMATAPQHTFQLLTKRHARMRSLLSRAEFRAEVQRAALSLRGVGAPWLVEPWWPLGNVWLGVSVENQQWADIRIPALLDTSAAVRWISAEPLLGPVDLHNCGGVDAIEQDWTGGPGGGSGAPHPFLDWVICGGESGPGARPMHPDWARSLRDQCTAAGVPFFMKQNGQYAPVADRPAAGDVWVARDGAVCDWGPGDGHVRAGGGDFRWPGGRTVLMRRARNKHDAGRELDGRTWDEYPT